MRTGRQDGDEYYKIFATTVDTINIISSNAGMHPSVFKKYFKPLKERGVKELWMELAELTPAELKTIKEEATLNAKEAAQGEYLACLFLLLADNERCAPPPLQGAA